MRPGPPRALLRLGCSQVHRSTQGLAARLRGSQGRVSGRKFTGSNRWGCILYGMEVDLWARGTAVYGAILSTALGLYALRRDRVKVRVGAYFELTSDAGVTRLSVLIVKATNVGRRSVTVKGVFVCEGKERRFITFSTRLGKPSNTLEPTSEIDHRCEPAVVTERTTKLGYLTPKKGNGGSLANISRTSREAPPPTGVEVS